MKIYNVGLFLLQRLSRVGPGGAKGLPEDGEDGDHEGQGDCGHIYPECVADLYNRIR